MTARISTRKAAAELRSIAEQIDDVAERSHVLTARDLGELSSAIRARADELDPVAASSSGSNGRSHDHEGNPT